MGAFFEQLTLCGLRHVPTSHRTRPAPLRLLSALRCPKNVACSSWQNFGTAGEFRLLLDVLPVYSTVCTLTCISTAICLALLPCTTRRKT